MNKLLFLIFFLGSFAMLFVMAYTGASLKTPSTPHGILHLEFAYNTAKTSVVLNAWAPTALVDNIAAAKLNTYCDFIFLLFYSGFLFFACKKVAAMLGNPISKAGSLLAKGAIATGFLDVLENAGMLLTLNNYPSPIIAFSTSFFSIIKWVLALIIVLYILTGVLVWAYQKIRH